MLNSRDWQHYRQYISTVSRGNYVTVLCNYGTFQQVVEEVAQYQGREPGQRPFAILSSVIVSDEDADFLEQHQIPHVVVNG